MNFDRFQVCLGYYWYAHYSYKTYEEACEIMARLNAIGFSPAPSDECSDAITSEVNYLAREVYERLGGQP